MQIVTVRRALPAVLTAAALIFGASACGGGDVDKGALVSKLKADPDLKLTDAQASCMADAVIKYVDADGLNKYIKGDAKEIPDPPKDKEDEATKAVQACAK